MCKYCCEDNKRFDPKITYNLCNNVVIFNVPQHARKINIKIGKY